MAQKGAFFEIFKPIIWAQLCAYGNCPCTKRAILGQLTRLIPGKLLELRIQKKFSTLLVHGQLP